MSTEEKGRNEQINNGEKFRVLPFSPLRRRVQNYLRFSARHLGFASLITCDVECYQAFVEVCRVQKVRPPSLTAYVARCLGVVLEQNLELLAVPCGKQFLVPCQVDLMVAIEATTTDEEKTPSFLPTRNVGQRSLDDIAQEMTRGVREMKRQRIVIAKSRFFPPASPDWWQRLGASLKAQRKRNRAERLATKMCVRLSSTTHWLQGRSGWGVPLYTTTAMAVTLGGMLKRALVIDDQIVARTCIDIAVHFDHEVTDGAPATRFIVALSQEIESGRVLNEYKLEPRRARQVSSAP